MNAFYEDILALSKQPPLWFDEHAVPRFCKFKPDEVADIYADEVALSLIRCQSCHAEFKVAFSLNSMNYYLQANRRRLWEEITGQSLHYGDPPNVRCCAAGPTMNSEMVKVLEYWQRSEDFFEWERKPELEVEFPDED